MKNLKITIQKVLLFLFLNLSLFFAYVKAIIYICQDLNFLANSENTNEKTLVAFDIDEVLITYPDKALSPYYEKYLGKIDDQTFSEITFTHPEALVNQDSPEIIQLLQQRNVKTIALTSRLTGVMGRVNSIEIYNHDFTFNCLQHFGIDFRNSFPDWNDIFLTLSQEPFPFFKNGIIFANNNSKGQALVSFLTTIVLSWQFTKIIFVDNELKHLESVEKALTDYESRIEFVGLHHTLEASQLQPLTKLDFQVKNFQINYFWQTGEWLHDDQAKKRMLNRKPKISLLDFLTAIKEFENK